MPTLVSKPAKTAVTGAGAVGYESGSQACNGKIAAFTPNATKSITWISCAVPWSISDARIALCAMFTVPSAA